MLSLFVSFVGLAGSAQTELRPPLSPAAMPPPVAATPPTQPQKPRTPSFGLDTSLVPGSVQLCQRKAMTFLSSQAGFIHLELCQDGTIQGYTKTERILVLVAPVENGCEMIVLAVRWDNPLDMNPSRLASEIGRIEPDPKSPMMIGARVPELESQLPAIFWRLEMKHTNPMTSNHRRFGCVAAMFLEKHGFETREFPPDPEAVSTFGRKLQEKSHVVIGTTMICAGKDRLNLFLGVAEREETARNAMSPVANDLLKLLYQ